MKWVRRASLALLVAAAMALFAWAFRKKPIAVEVARVERGEFVEAVEEPGKTRVRERFVLSAPVGGELARVLKRPGDRVQPREVLATIRPVAPAMIDARQRGELDARLEAALASQTLSGASVERAKTVRSFAEKEVARLKALAEKGAAPAHDLERAELDLQIAEKDLKTAELSAHVAEHAVEVARAVARSVVGPDVGPDVAAGVSSGASSGATSGAGSGVTKGVIDVGKVGGAWPVRSPLEGRVLRVLQSSEGVVAAGTPLLELADPNDLEVVVAVLTSDAVRLQPGTRSVIDRWGGPTPLEGRVRSIEPSGYTKLSALGVEEQRVDVVIDLVSPPAAWASLGDAFRVHTRTVVFRQLDAVKTSAATLFRDGDAWALFVVEAGRAARRRVHVARRNGLEVVLSGIDVGATVVNFPSSALADGAAVEVR